MASNDNANGNVVVVPSESWVQQEKEVVSNVQEMLKGNPVNAVICVAGGWAGGNMAASGMFQLILSVIVTTAHGLQISLYNNKFNVNYFCPHFIPNANHVDFKMFNQNLKLINKRI